MRLKKAIIHDEYAADVGMLKGYVYIAMPSYCETIRLNRAQGKPLH